MAETKREAGFVADEVNEITVSIEAEVKKITTEFPPVCKEEIPNNGGKEMGTISDRGRKSRAMYSQSFATRYRNSKYPAGGEMMGEAGRV